MKRTSWASGSVARASATAPARKSTYSGSRCQLSMGTAVARPGLGRLGQPALVLAHARARVVRGEDEADDRAQRPGTSSSAAASSMNGGECFWPSTTVHRPGARSSSAACSPARCASVRSASGEVPPIAS